jgi:hypothetical protein
MREATPPRPNTPSWSVAQLKESTVTTLPLPLLARAEHLLFLYVSEIYKG